MSTRSYIAKKISEDKYLAIYCHSDGYLTYNGALLLDYYNTPEQVDKLLALGDISYLAERLEPDPTKPHNFDSDKRQEGVVLAYGRDKGDTGTAARVLTFEQLTDTNSLTEYVYIFDEYNKWKYLNIGDRNNIKDVKKDLCNEYSKYGITRPVGYYGFIDADIASDFLERGEAKKASLATSWFD